MNIEVPPQSDAYLRFLGDEMLEDDLFLDSKYDIESKHDNGTLEMKQQNAYDLA